MAMSDRRKATEYVLTGPAADETNPQPPLQLLKAGNPGSWNSETPPSKVLGRLDVFPAESQVT